MSGARDDIINLFEKRTFAYKENVFRTKEEEPEEESKEESKKERTKNDFEYTEGESKDTNYDLFKEYFYSSVPSALAKKNTRDKR